MKNWDMYRSLHGRGLTQAKLAQLTGIDRSVLANILANVPGRGKETRHKLFPHLWEREIKLLGWTKEYAAWAEAEYQKQKLEGELEMYRAQRGRCAMCHGSTGNNVPAREPEVAV